MNPTATGNQTAPFRPRRTLSDAVELLVEESLQCESPRFFLKRALAIVAETFGARVAAFELRLLSSVFGDRLAPSRDHLPFWEPAIQSALTDSISEGCGRARLYRRRNGDGRLVVMGVPLRAATGRGGGALMLACDCADQDAAGELLMQLSSLAGLISVLMEVDQDASAPAASSSTETLSALQKAGRYANTTELAYAITNKLRSRDGCDLVALARVHGTRVKLLSISGLDEIKQRSPGVRIIQAAMEECRDFGVCVIPQKNGLIDDAQCVTRGRLHHKWHVSADGAAVASIPLRDGDQIVAILGVRRSPHQTFDDKDIEEFRSLVEPYAATLSYIERASQSLWQHACATFGSALEDLCTRGSYARKLALVTPLLMAMWLAFGTLDYEVTVPASIKPTRARQIGAPQDGVLSSVHFSPGYRVQAGELLCSFDVTELELEHKRLASELEILAIQENQALADNVPVDIQLTRANKAQLQANLELIEYRVAAAHVRAPVDGTVIQGDLNDRVGDVFAKGEPLFEIATSEGWKLELSIPEYAVSDVQVGLSGRFSSLARAEEAFPLVVSRVDPGAIGRDGENVFIAEAEVELDSDWIRSGMEGVARVEIGERNAWWALFHRASDWLHLRLWL